MSTKYSLANPNPNFPVYIRDAGETRRSAQRDIADKKNRKTNRRPNGGRGCRRIRRAAQKV